MALMSIDDLEQAAEALAIGATSYTLPNGTTINRTGLEKLMTWIEHRKAQEDDAAGGIVSQLVEFDA